MSFLTDAALKQVVADQLQLDLATLPSRWDRIVADANEKAYQTVRGAMLLRGWDASQIDSWDRGAEFQRDIGLYWAMVAGAGLHGYPSEWVKMLDRRPDLKEAIVEQGGTSQVPAGTPEVNAYGTFDTDSDTYTRDQIW